MCSDYEIIKIYLNMKKNFKFMIVFTILSFLWSIVFNLFLNYININYGYNLLEDTIQWIFAFFINLISAIILIISYFYLQSKQKFITMMVVYFIYTIIFIVTIFFSIYGLYNLSSKIMIELIKLKMFYQILTFTYLIVLYYFLFIILDLLLKFVTKIKYLSKLNTSKIIFDYNLRRFNARKKLNSSKRYLKIINNHNRKINRAKKIFKRNTNYDLLTKTRNKDNL